MKRIVALALLLLTVGALFPPDSVFGQAYPARQITYLICFDPGGQSDREARRQQPPLDKSLGQQVIIDIPHVILQPLQQEVGYKTEQIEPVVVFQRTPLGPAVLSCQREPCLFCGL